MRCPLKNAAGHDNGGEGSADQLDRCDDAEAARNAHAIASMTAMAEPSNTRPLLSPASLNSRA